MAIAVISSLSAATVSSSEYSITNNSTSLATNSTAGMYQVFVDTTNVAAGDEFECALLEKVISGGTQRRKVIARFVGAQAEVMFQSIPSLLIVGWDYTLKKIAGTDRTFNASIRGVT